MFWLFWRWGSYKLFARAGLKLRASRSQPPKKLGLQGAEHPAKNTIFKGSSYQLELFVWL
jgi:hypothetical protein